MQNLFKHVNFVCLYLWSLRVDEQHQEEGKNKKNLLASGDCSFKSNYPASNDDNESCTSVYFEMTIESMCPWKFEFL